MPFAWILIVILWWAISAIGTARKRQAAQTKKQSEQAQSRQKTAEQYARQQAQSQAAPAMSRQDDWDDEEENWDERDAARSRPAPAPQPAPKPPQVPRHETRPLQAHMHTPVMGAEGTGTEGEDCCHEFMLDQRPEQPADFLPMQEENEGLRAKALLQGVIYSEILGRRPVKRYGAKRA